jgi:hypothetical protein
MTQEERNEIKRHFDLVSENLRSEIRLVAEGVAMNTERLDRLDVRFDSLEGKVDRMEDEFHVFRDDTQRYFAELRVFRGETQCNFDKLMSEAQGPSSPR